MIVTHSQSAALNIIITECKDVSFVLDFSPILCYTYSINNRGVITHEN